MTSGKSQKAETTTINSSAVAKAMYAAVGAPVVAGRRAKTLGSDIGGRFAGYGTKVTEGFSNQYSTWAEEGEVVTKQIQDRKVVDDVKEKVDLEQLQERVGKLREQLEHTMVQWRDSFTPATKPTETKTGAAKTPVETEAKPAAKTATKASSAKTTTKTSPTKTTAKAAATKPAAKKTTVKAASAKAPSAKTGPDKTTEK